MIICISKVVINNFNSHSEPCYQTRGAQILDTKSLGHLSFFLVTCATDMRHLAMGLRSEKCVIRRFQRCAKVIECTYTNLDSTV